MNLVGFTSVQVSELYESFSTWLLARVGPHKAALTINGYYSFFAKLEKYWQGVPAYDDLVRAFGAAGLRKAENPMRWLQEVGAVTVSVERRDEHTEQRRVSNLLSELPDFWSKQLLHGYHSELVLRTERNQTDMRSVRLALRAAVNFLKIAALAPQTHPNMKALEAFWRSSPGQVAAATGFVGYLNKAHNTELQTRPDKQWLEKAKKDKAERELIALLDGTGVASEPMWIAKALAYFHNVRRVSGKALKYRIESFNGTAGFSVEHEGKSLWVPSVSSYIRPPTGAGAISVQHPLG